MTRNMMKEQCILEDTRRKIALLLKGLVEIQDSSVSMYAPDDGGAGAPVEISVTFPYKPWHLLRKKKVANMVNIRLARSSLNNRLLRFGNVWVSDEHVVGDRTLSKFRISITVEVKVFGHCILERNAQSYLGSRVGISGKQLDEFVNKMAT